jgi:hypothetical protein
MTVTNGAVGSLILVGILGASLSPGLLITALGVSRLNIDGVNSVLSSIGTTLGAGKSKLGFAAVETELSEEKVLLDAIASSYKKHKMTGYETGTTP